MREVRVPVIVIGSGIAGLSFSLKVSDLADVLLVTKKAEGSSQYRAPIRPASSAQRAWTL